MADSKKLSIIIVAYYDTRCLEHCVASIYQKLVDFSDWEIIIVNNDENQSIAQVPLDFSKVKIIDHKKNIGFGSGVNLGVKTAEGEFLFILNPDTEIITDNLPNLLQEFFQDTSIGIIGAGIINKNQENQKWSAGRELSLYDLFRNNLGLSRSKNTWNRKSKTNCDWVAGTALFIKKELFENLGGFDENFFMYFEDMDLCRRARKLGKKVVFFPEFKVFHSSGESYADKKLQKRDYYNSMGYYFKKHKGWWQWRVIKLARKFLVKA